MKSGFTKIFTLGLALITTTICLTACGGTWVELSAGMLSNKCTDKQVEENKKELINGMARGLFTETCNKMGKKFDNDVRCNNGRIEAKCK